MTVQVDSASDFSRRSRELVAETRRDKARFATYLLTVLVFVLGSFLLWLIGAAW